MATQMEKQLTQEEKATNAETWEHINNVMKLLARMQFELSKRMFTHDRSKLAHPEVDTFVEFTPNLKDSTYGSPEYNQFLKDMKPALDHHYAHNRHHPEFSTLWKCPVCNHICKEQEIPAFFLEVEGDDLHKHKFCPRCCPVSVIYESIMEPYLGVEGMNLIDLLEMLCDWKAATMRHNDGDINRSIELNTSRFNLSPQLVSIFKNTLPLLHDIFANLQTQKDI